MMRFKRREMMWPKNYRDYPVDTSLKHSQVKPGQGIVGCEMHEINGWGEERHVYKRKEKRSTLVDFVKSLFSKK